MISSVVALRCCSLIRRGSLVRSRTLVRCGALIGRRALVRCRTVTLWLLFGALAFLRLNLFVQKTTTGK